MKNIRRNWSDQNRWTSPGLLKFSILGIVIIIVISWVNILSGDSGFSDLFRSQTWARAFRFLQDLTGYNNDKTPAFLDVDRWIETGKLAYQTLAMSVLSISMAGLFCLLTFLPGARNLSDGDTVPGWPRFLGIIYLPLRLFFVVTRSIPELIVAMIVIFFVSPGILAGAIALALHNYGILSKLAAEIVENMDIGPIRAMKSSGSSPVQALVYGIIPLFLPQFLTYLTYRWEVVIRTTIVIGFVSAGGLGREFRLDMHLFRYTDVFLILLWYLILVMMVDLVSSRLRRLAQ